MNLRLHNKVTTSPPTRGGWMVLEGYAPHSPFDVTDTCRTGVRRDFHQPGWSAAALQQGRRLPTTGNTSGTREREASCYSPEAARWVGVLDFTYIQGRIWVLERERTSTHLTSLKFQLSPFPTPTSLSGELPTHNSTRATPFTTPPIFVSSSSCSSLCGQHVESVQA